MDGYIWLSAASEMPPGALGLEVTYMTGNQSSKEHLSVLNPVLAPALGCANSSIFAGSLNLWADGPVRLPSPGSKTLGAFIWYFVPIVLARKAIGIVARREDSGDIPFLEAFACERLVPQLDLLPGARLNVCLLPGHYLTWAG